MPFAVGHLSPVQLAFPASDYYGTADCLQCSLCCNTPIAELSNVPKSLSLWSFLTVEALRPLPYTGRSESCFESQLPHDSTLVLHPAGREVKNQHLPLSPRFTLSGAVCSYDAAQLSLAGSHRLRKPAPLLSMPFG